MLHGINGVEPPHCGTEMFVAQQFRVILQVGTFWSCTGGRTPGGIPEIIQTVATNCVVSQI